MDRSANGKSVQGNRTPISPFGGPAGGPRTGVSEADSGFMEPNMQ